MIGLLLALAFSAAPDSSDAPFHFSLFAGPEITQLHDATLWLETSGQVEFSDIAVIRYAYSSPFSSGGGKYETRASDLQRAMHTFSVAKEWRKNTGWCALGGGWSWLRLDTTARYIDPRPLYVDNGDGLYLVTTSSSGLMGSSNAPASIGWKWAVPVKDRSPYLFVEVGNGWNLMSGGFRAEYRYGFNAGFFVRLRIPTLSGSKGKEH